MSAAHWSPILPGNTAIYTTRAAARFLGVSVPTVQQLVETGALVAWKTAGGHRRIPESALLDYLDQHLPSEMAGTPRAERRAKQLRLLVMSPSSQILQLCQTVVSKWSLPVRATACASDYGALLIIGLFRPDIIVLDLDGNELDMYKVLDCILTTPELSACRVAVLATEASSGAFGGLPEGVACFHKPLDLEGFRAYLVACCVGKQPTSTETTSYY